jgi:hypothetical protein
VELDESRGGEDAWLSVHGPSHLVQPDQIVERFGSPVRVHQFELCPGPFSLPQESASLLTVVRREVFEISLEPT